LTNYSGQLNPRTTAKMLYTHGFNPKITQTITKTKLQLLFTESQTHKWHFEFPILSPYSL